VSGLISVAHRRVRVDHNRLDSACLAQPQHRRRRVCPGQRGEQPRPLSLDQLPEREPGADGHTDQHSGYLERHHDRVHIAQAHRELVAVQLGPLRVDDLPGGELNHRERGELDVLGHDPTSLRVESVGS
jgi:hypothetical protein